MPRKPNIQLLQKLKAILEDPNIPSHEKTNASLAKRLGISKRYVIILKKKLSSELKNKFTGELIKSSPTSSSTGKSVKQTSKTVDSPSEKARRKLLSASHDKCKAPVEMRSASMGVGSLLRGMGLCRVHGLILDVGVVSGSFERSKNFGYSFRFHGNLSNMFRIFKFGEKRYFEVRVYRNDRVLVYVNCSGSPLDADDLINFWGFLSSELYRLNGFKFIDADRIVVEKVELNNDSSVVEFVFKNSPAKVVTFKTFSGAFVRLYESKKRFEVGGPAPEASKLAGLIQVLNGGLNLYYIQQILGQFLQNMRYIESLRREVEVLRSQVDDLAGRLKMNNYNLPKPAQSSSLQTMLIVETPGAGSSRSYLESSRQLPAQPKAADGVCPFFKNNGCCANISGYPSFVGRKIVESYCTSGHHQECWQYQYYVKHYGG